MWTDRYQSRDRNQFESAGSIRIHQDGENVAKPGWYVLLKLIGTIGMLVIGIAIVIPSLPLPGDQAIVVACGFLLVYTGLGYFVRPEPNVDNLGTAWGHNDRTQFNDNINRGLLNLHMMLGPARFISDTLIDTATFAGILPERTAKDIQQQDVQQSESELEQLRDEIKDRVEQRFADKEHQGTVELDSMKYLKQ